MRNKFISEVKNNGFVIIDNGEFQYNVSLVNKDNFPDMSEMLISQLKNEGLYDNSFIGHLSRPGKKGSVQMLPIYGNKDKYVTKWFKSSVDEVIKADLRSKGMELLKRYM